ncbi:MAG: hypothetical protein RL266_2826 [Bacteroidota bacterium]|jgi:hypothetical protein
MLVLLRSLIISSMLFAQNPCEDLLLLIGQRDISEEVVRFKERCGPFQQTIAQDGMSKTWTNSETGMELTFVNRSKDQFALAQFEVMMVELTSFTNDGGFKADFPFGFKLGMDHKMVKTHIEQLQSVQFDKKDLSKSSSSFTYTGSPNGALQNRQIRVSISQFDGRSITSMRLRLK